MQGQAIFPYTVACQSRYTCSKKGEGQELVISVIRKTLDQWQFPVIWGGPSSAAEFFSEVFVTGPLHCWLGQEPVIRGCVGQWNWPQGSATVISRGWLLAIERGARTDKQTKLPGHLWPYMPLSLAVLTLINNTYHWLDFSMQPASRDSPYHKKHHWSAGSSPIKKHHRSAGSSPIKKHHRSAGSSPIKPSIRWSINKDGQECCYMVELNCSVSYTALTRSNQQAPNSQLF